MRFIGFSIIILFLTYQLIPNFYARHFNKHVFHRMPNKAEAIALTFDDGPDPVYTPQLLDLLKKENVHATFFLVAERAKAHPEIVERMQKEGHAIGLHSFAHRGFWLENPNQTRLDFEESIEIFQALHVDLVGFRPPWGTFNALTAHYAQKEDLPIFLWSRNAKDWDIDTSAEDIVKRVSAGLENGEIIVLHDAGGDKGAPAHTIEALELALPRLKENYQFVTLEEGGDSRELDSAQVPST